MTSQTHRLLSVAQAVSPLLAVAEPRPRRRLVAESLGLVLAQAVVAPRALPETPTALRAGVAIASHELVGASAQSPAFLRQRPASVGPGDPMPPGTDAVLSSAALAGEAPLIEVIECVAPGEHVRLAGHDLSAGVVLAGRGAIMTAALQFACSLAGITDVSVLCPCVALPDGANDAAGHWLASQLAAMGCEVTSGAADLTLVWAAPGPPGLALNPGDGAFAGLADDRPVIHLPRRFDGLVGAFFALAVPVLERLTGRSFATIRRPLTRKISSAVGNSDIVLLRQDGGGLTPLLVGEITLAALAAADAIGIIPPENEGFASGEMMAAVPLSPDVPPGDRHDR